MKNALKINLQEHLEYAREEINMIERKLSELETNIKEARILLTETISSRAAFKAKYEALIEFGIIEEIK